MTISSHHPSKYETAVFLAGGLALACLERISPVGVLGVGGRRLHVQPSLSKDQILEWLHRLRTFHYDEPTSLGSAADRADAQPAQRVLVIVLSDMHDPRALPALQAAGARSTTARAAIARSRRGPAPRRRVCAGRARQRPAGRSSSAAGSAGSTRRTSRNSSRRRASITC